MELLGLSGTQLLTAMLAAGVAIGLLYLLKNEERRVIVPSLTLWELAMGQKTSRRLWTRLRRLLSLLLALTIAALMLLSIADPRAVRPDQARTIVVLIDASASMQAEDAKPSRLEHAKELAAQAISQLEVGDRALVAQLDTTATPLSALSDDVVQLRHAVASVQPTDLPSDLATGMRFALNVLAGAPRGEIWLYSDGNLQNVERAGEMLRGEHAPKLTYNRIGSESRNVAIESFSVRRYPLDKSRQEGLISLRNFADQPETVTLRVLAGGVPLQEETLELGPREHRTRVLSNLGASQSALEATISLSPSDVQPRDDVAYAALPSRKRARVLLVSQDNRYVEAALLLDEYLDVQQVAPTEYQSADGFDVVVLDGFVPRVPPNAAALYLHPQPEAGREGPFVVRGEAQRPIFEHIDPDHPATRHAALRDVNIARALVLEPRPEDRVLAHGAKKLPLIVEGVRDGQRFLALAFDVRQSDFPLRVGLPLFLLGAIDALTQGSDEQVVKNLVGESYSVQVDPALKQATLSQEDESRTLAVSAGKVRVSVAKRGVYTLTAGDAQTTIAANVPADREGDIAPRDEIVVKGVTPVKTVTAGTFRSDRPWLWLALSATLLLTFEWLSYHRRWTV